MTKFLSSKKTRASAHWFHSASAVRGTVKKPLGFEEWFYTGPTYHFGHFPPKKGGGKK